MADDPDPAPEKDDEIDLRRQTFWDRYGDDRARIAFMSGGKSSPQIKDAIDKWIEEGWKFDWIFGSLFANNVYMKGGWVTNDEVNNDGEPYGVTLPVDDWIRHLKSLQDTVFIPRMNMLLDHGIDPMITSSELKFTIPNVRRMKREDHFQLAVLSSNIQFLVYNNVKIEFDNLENPSMIMRAIGNACVDLPYAIERWEDELLLFEQGMEETYKESTYIKHFRHYENTVPQRLAELLVHLAQIHGSNAYQAARDNT
eukprot:7382811-Prymnesium_polylepis.1